MSSNSRFINIFPGTHAMSERLTGMDPNLTFGNSAGSARVFLIRGIVGYHVAQHILIFISSPSTTELATRHTSWASHATGGQIGMAILPFFPRGFSPLFLLRQAISHHPLISRHIKSSDFSMWKEGRTFFNSGG